VEESRAKVATSAVPPPGSSLRSVPFTLPEFTISSAKKEEPGTTDEVEEEKTPPSAESVASARKLDVQ
jgi:hypothetical protein